MKTKPKKTMPRASAHVGAFECGFEQLDLMLRPGTGGEFTSCANPGRLPRITVGAQDRASEWHLCYAVLVHEIWECAFFRQGLRYANDNRVHPKSHADYLFVFTHEQFQDCAAKVSEFMVKAIPALKEAFDKWHGVKPNARK